MLVVQSSILPKNRAESKCSPCHRPQAGERPSDCRQLTAFGKVATVVEPSAAATAVDSPAHIYDTICPKCRANPDFRDFKKSTDRDRSASASDRLELPRGEVDAR